MEAAGRRPARYWRGGSVMVTGRLCPIPLLLTAVGYKAKGVQFADLSWVPVISGDTVVVIRDGNVIATISDTGFFTDNTGVKGNNATYVYQICVVQTGDCSNLAQVKFGKR